MGVPAGLVPCIDQSFDLDKLNLSDRLKIVINSETKSSRRYAELEAISGIPADNWKSFWHGKQRPTADMIEAVCKNWTIYPRVMMLRRINYMNLAVHLLMMAVIIFDLKFIVEILSVTSIDGVVFPILALPLLCLFGLILVYGLLWHGKIFPILDEGQTSS